MAIQEVLKLLKAVTKGNKNAQAAIDTAALIVTVAAKLMKEAQPILDSIDTDAVAEKLKIATRAAAESADKAKAAAGKFRRRDTGYKGVCSLFLVFRGKDRAAADQRHGALAPPGTFQAHHNMFFRRCHAARSSDRAIFSPLLPCRPSVKKPPSPLP